jgi:hypothetical protein
MEQEQKLMLDTTIIVSGFMDENGEVFFSIP